MTPKEQSDLDQSLKALIDNLCPMWASMFTKLVEEGLLPDQALSLVKVYIFTTCRPQK